MNIKERIKSLLKIAQDQSGPSNISGSPPTVDFVSLFKYAADAWGSENIAQIQHIVNMLNQTIFILSASQINFDMLRLSSFNVDISKYPDVVLAATIRFSQLVYNTMLTDHSSQFHDKLSSDEKRLIVSKLAQTLGTSNIPGGSINSFLKTKIGGDLKELLGGALITIK